MNINQKLPSVEHMRQVARKRIPRFGRDYLEGVIGQGRCLQHNRTALDRVQLELFTALEQERRKRLEAEQEVHRLKMSLAMAAANQHQAMQFTVGLAASAFGGGEQLVKQLSLDPS